IWQAGVFDFSIGDLDFLAQIKLAALPRPGTRARRVETRRDLAVNLRTLRGEWGEMTQPHRLLLGDEGSHLTGEDGHRLPSPAFPQGFTEISTRHCQVGDALLEAVAASPHATALESIYLSYGYSVSDRGVQALTEGAAGLPQLRALDLTG